MRIFFFAKLIVITIYAGINIHFLYKTFGWSTKLLGVFFSSITHKLISQSHKNMYIKNQEFDGDSLEIKKLSTLYE